MSIDWFTVVAQWINFLVLVFLLKRFLYGPIIRAMDAREARVRGELESAEKTRKEAEETAADFRRRRAELEAGREEVLAESREEAARTREELEAEARREVEAERKRWRRALADRRESFLRDLRRRLAEGVVEVSRRALADLADAELEDLVVRAFEERMKDLPGEEWDALGKEAAKGGSELAVRTAFALPEEARERLGKHLAKALPDAPEPVFETAKEVVCGIELRAGGRKVAWSIDEQLDRLADRIDEQLKEAASEPEPEDGAAKAEAAGDEAG